MGVELWRRSSRLTPGIPPLSQDDQIHVFFNQSEASVYTDPYRQIQRYGDDLEQIILDAIDQATQSIDVAVQELTLPRIAEALARKANAGVEVRIILENNYSQPWSNRDRNWLSDQDDYTRGKYDNLLALGDQNGDGRISAAEAAAQDAVLILQNAQLPIIDDTADGTKGTGLMHHKFMVVDDRWVMTGSANWTLSGLHGDMVAPESRGNANALLRIDSPELAAIYTDEFQVMWGDGPEGQHDSLFGAPKPARAPRRVDLSGSAVIVQFAPNTANTPWEQTVNGLIEQTLQQAQNSVDLALFVFTEQELADQLAVKAQSGVQVRALIDRSFIYRSYSEALDMLGVTLPDHNCRYEKDNRVWQSPMTAVGYPETADGDKLHHKFAVIDDSIVIIGSHNWSKSANTQNDENILLIQNRTVAQHFQREFERLYRDANLGSTAYLQNKIREAQRDCG